MNISNAILELKSDAQVSVDDNDVNKITWHDDNPTNITNEAITAKALEIETRDAHFEPRAKAYPSIQEQLDMQYHDTINGTTTWKDAIKAVKDANPKAE